MDTVDATIHQDNWVRIERFPGNWISIDRSVEAADVQKQRWGIQVQSLLFHPFAFWKHLTRKGWYLAQCLKKVSPFVSKSDVCIWPSDLFEPKETRCTNYALLSDLRNTILEGGVSLWPWGSLLVLDQMVSLMLSSGRLQLQNTSARPEPGLSFHLITQLSQGIFCALCPFC